MAKSLELKRSGQGTSWRVRFARPRGAHSLGKALRVTPDGLAERGNCRSDRALTARSLCCADLNRGRFPSNTVVTSKYTFFTFLPLNLFEQFRKAATFYFLIIMILALVGDRIGRATPFPQGCSGGAALAFAHLLN